MKYTDLAQDYFERHSQSDECHISSDGRVFHTYGHATSFAQEHQLQDQTIESYKRAQISDVAENPTVEDAEAEEKDSSEKLDEIFETPAGEIALEAFLKTNDVDVLKYDDLKKFVKYFQIETEDQKADTLKAALNEFKNTLNS